MEFWSIWIQVQTERIPRYTEKSLPNILYGFRFLKIDYDYFGYLKNAVFMLVSLYQFFGHLM